MNALPQVVREFFPDHYFTLADVTLSWNDQEIVEVEQLSFSLVEQVQPIFGFDAYTFSAVSRGARMLQGRIQVPFLYPGYLFERLRAFPGETAPSSPDISKEEAQAALTKDALLALREAQQERVYKSAPRSRRKDAPTYFVDPPGGLNLVIRYGNPQDDTLFSFFGKQDPGYTYTIKGVFLQAKNHVVPHEGHVAELYPFIAQDLIPS